MDNFFFRSASNIDSLFFMKKASFCDFKCFINSLFKGVAQVALRRITIKKKLKLNKRLRVPAVQNYHQFLTLLTSDSDSKLNIIETKNKHFLII